MADIPNAAELARSIADLLEQEGIAYAIGGAIALGFYTVPRATRDVDVNAFVPVADGLVSLLERLGAGPLPGNVSTGAEPPRRLVPGIG